MVSAVRSQIIFTPETVEPIVFNAIEDVLKDKVFENSDVILPNMKYFVRRFIDWLTGLQRPAGSDLD